MDKITVAELASECSVQNQVVLSELKRLGLYVFSPSATIDATFADTIRKKILNQRETDEARQAEAEKKKEAHEETAKQGKKIAAKKAVTPAEAPEAPKAKKGVKKPEKAPEVKHEEETHPRLSLAPRKGRKHYDRETAELVEVVAPVAAQKPAELTNLEAAQRVLSGIGAPVGVPPPRNQRHRRRNPSRQRQSLPWRPDRPRLWSLSRLPHGSRFSVSKSLWRILGPSPRKSWSQRRRPRF